jgi:PAS domain S-box-containing protein
MLNGARATAEHDGTKGDGAVTDPICRRPEGTHDTARMAASADETAMAAQGWPTEAIEALSEGLAIYDADERLVFCNEEYRRTLPRLAALGILQPGISFSDILRTGIARGFVPAGYRDGEDYFAKRLDRFRNPAGQHEYQSTAGRWYRCEETKTSNGGTVAIRADITDHKAIELSLKESEEGYRNLTEGSFQGICIISPERKPLYVNQAYAEIFGYDSPDDILALESTAGLAAPYDRDRLANYRKERLHGNFAPTFYEYDGIRRDGAIVHLQAISRPVTWKGRKAVQVTLLNITERKQAERALRESEIRLRAIVDNSPWLITLKDKSKNYLVVNEAYARSMNVSVDEVIGKNASDIASPEYASQVGAYDDEVIQSRQMVTFERDIVLPDGSREVRSVNKYPALDADGQVLGVATIAIDITERKEAEAKRQELENSLRQAQKMEVVGQLTGGVAHDFNNLLGIIIGNLDFLEEALRDKPDLHALIEPAIQAALSGAALNRQLLSFSRQQSLSPKVMNLNDHASGMLSMLRRTLGETIEIRTALTDELWLAKVDGHYLESALLNLAVNSRDAMPDGGSLTIATYNFHLDESTTAAWGELGSGDYVVLSITDTGVGIPPEILERVFEPFFTTKAVGQGSGLGLSMVFGFAKQSGGHVTIDSTVNEGTTVRLYLPRAASDGPADKDRTDGRISLGRGETVLVVEDEPSLRKLIVTMLQDLGCTALDARDGHSALALLEQGGKPGVLLTDVVLPGGISGPDLATAVRERDPAIQVMFMSGYPRDVMAQQHWLQDEILLQKPFRKSELADRLAEAFGTLAGT